MVVEPSIVTWPLLTKSPPPRRALRCRPLRPRRRPHYRRCRHRSGISRAVSSPSNAAVSSITAASTNSLILRERVARENQRRALSDEHAAPFARASGTPGTSSASVARQAVPTVASIKG